MTDIPKGMDVVGRRVGTGKFCAPYGSVKRTTVHRG